MLRLFKRDPIAKLEKEYARTLQQARDAQRHGKLQVYADLAAEAEAMNLRLATLRRPR